MGGAVDRFGTELRSLYKAAGEPTLSRLVRLGLDQVPPLQISDSTLSAWLNAGNVPGPGAKERYFLLLVAHLNRLAAKVEHPTRPEGAWAALLKTAREERKAHRGGRPRTAAGSTGSDPHEVPQTVSVVDRVPPRPVTIVGRDDSLDELLARLVPQDTASPSSVVTLVSGMGGAGKTTLAVEAAHRTRDLGWFTGGTFFIDMRGYSGNDADLGPVDAAALLLRHLGTAEGDIPPAGDDVLSLWQARADQLAGHGRPLLVVLDNVSSAGQILPLVPARPHHRIVVTSRHVLASIPGRHINLSDLSRSSSAQVLDQALRIAHPEDSRATDAPEHAERIGELCGGLPLALQIVAAILRTEPRRPLASVVEELADTRSRLDGLAYEDVDALGSPMAVRAAFVLSYRRLAPPDARAFRLLALAPGPDFSIETAGVLLSAIPLETRQVVRRLVAAHLLDCQVPERWTMHDLIRLYAQEKAEEPHHGEEMTESLERILVHLQQSSREADRRIRWKAGVPESERFASSGEAWDWFDAEHRTLMAAVATAYRAGFDLMSVSLAMNMVGCFEQRAHLDWRNIFDTAEKAAGRIMDPRIDVEVLGNIGVLYGVAHQPERALSFLSRAIELIEELGGHPGEASVLNSAASALMELGYLQEALSTMQLAMSVFRKEGNKQGEGMMHHNIASLFLRNDTPERALEHLEQDLAICGELGDRVGEGGTLNTLGKAYFELRQYEEAAAAFRKGLAIAREFRDVVLEGHCLKNLGNACAELAQFDKACALYEEALEVQRAHGDRFREGETLMNLGLTHHQLNRHAQAVDCFRQAIDAFEEAGVQDAAHTARAWLRDVVADTPGHTP
ncbi:tetratricopeptide repeat protein [Streptomyces platensis]|uniref:ATP-binding protein n=1 Tax=Streptomyces platensis TaxID=58346 RepID=UPI00225125A0|nr:tetratricopeptide repeat protein [Streptomyces platensis]MCX4640786.1 tetratricopeptide repeat protein [Streptomyces platensis]